MIERPNVLVWGVGGSNTSITARQVAALGWNLGDADAQFAESVSVRDYNRGPVRRGQLERAEALAILRALPEPWVLKEPQLLSTIDQWLGVLAEFRPLLLWICKPAEQLAETYRRRGAELELPAIRRRIERAEAVYRRWPWAKLRLAAADVARAVELFDLARWRASSSTGPPGA